MFKWIIVLRRPSERDNFRANKSTKNMKFFVVVLCSRLKCMHESKFVAKTKKKYWEKGVSNQVNFHFLAKWKKKKIKNRKMILMNNTHTNYNNKPSNHRMKEEEVYEKKNKNKNCLLHRMFHMSSFVLTAHPFVLQWRRKKKQKLKINNNFLFYTHTRYSLCYTISIKRKK